MISVVVPVYNTQNYLDKCIMSVLQQTYDDLRLYLINDGSTDNSLSIMRKYEDSDERVTVFDCPHNGASAARNFGIEHSKGEFIAIIDSDDWIEQETFEILIRIMEKEDLDAIYYEWTEEFSDGEIDTKGREGKKSILMDEPLASFLNNTVSMRISSGIFRRNIIGEHRFEVGRSRGEDMLFEYAMAKESRKAKYIDYPFYHRINRLGSLSYVQGFNPRDVEIITCTDLILADVKKCFPQYTDLAYAYSFNFNMMVANYITFFGAESQYKEQSEYIDEHLKMLWKEMKTPKSVLPKSRYYAYLVYSKYKWIYRGITKLYYWKKGGRMVR